MGELNRKKNYAKKDQLFKHGHVHNFLYLNLMNF